jgi:hypothetical protein
VSDDGVSKHRTYTLPPVYSAALLLTCSVLFPELEQIVAQLSSDDEIHAAGTVLLRANLQARDGVCTKPTPTTRIVNLRPTGMQGGSSAITFTAAYDQKLDPPLLRSTPLLLTWTVNNASVGTEGAKQRA